MKLKLKRKKEKRQNERVPNEKCQMKKRDKTWLAALIDGEGCLQIDRQFRKYRFSYTACISVGMLDKQMIEYAFKITKLGTINLYREGRVWMWRVKSRNAMKLCKLMYPYLLIKKQQADNIIALCKNTAKRRKYTTEKDFKQREKLYIFNKELNQRNKKIKETK